MYNTETTTQRINRLKIIVTTLFVSVILLVSNSFSQGHALGENDKLYIGSYDAVPGQARDHAKSGNGALSRGAQNRILMARILSLLQFSSWHRLSV